MKKTQVAINMIYAVSAYVKSDAGLVYKVAFRLLYLI